MREFQCIVQFCMIVYTHGLLKLMNLHVVLFPLFIFCLKFYRFVPLAFQLSNAISAVVPVESKHGNAATIFYDLKKQGNLDFKYFFSFLCKRITLAIKSESREHKEEKLAPES